MRTIFLFLLLAIVQLSSGQPFRYISGNDIDRPSIKVLGIKNYKEYVSSVDDTNSKTLVRIVEYDTNGNLTRDWRFDPITKNQNQWTYRYSSKNLLLESATYFPDSMTYLQRFIHNYDTAGNEIEFITEGYNHGVLAATKKTLKSYDSRNLLVDMIEIKTDGTTVGHYGYVYDEFENRIEEITYDKSGKILYRRPVSYWLKEEEPIGFPPEPDPVLEALQKETTTYFADGTRKVEDGYGHRIFDSNDMLLFWEEKNYRKHWFEYSFY
jgi:hypothetical protein